jgi:hypothetical protein
LFYPHQLVMGFLALVVLGIDVGVGDFAEYAEGLDAGHAEHLDF